MSIETTLHAVGFVSQYQQISVPTSQEGPPSQQISVEDITPTLRDLLKTSGLQNGLLTVISRHTTTTIVINEYEQRLAQDIQEYCLKLAPPDERSISSSSRKGIRYYHNDIDQRPASSAEMQRCVENGYDVVNDPVQLEAWRQQEPINAHSHLLSMMVGSTSESIPVVEGKLMIGDWQSILMVDFDGPRNRTVGVQWMGSASSE